MLLTADTFVLQAEPRPDSSTGSLQCFTRAVIRRSPGCTMLGAQSLVAGSLSVHVFTEPAVHTSAHRARLRERNLTPPPPRALVSCRGNLKTHSLILIIPHNFGKLELCCENFL